MVKKIQDDSLKITQKIKKSKGNQQQQAVNIGINIFKKELKKQRKRPTKKIIDDKKKVNITPPFISRGIYYPYYNINQSPAVFDRPPNISLNQPLITTPVEKIKTPSSPSSPIITLAGLRTKPRPKDIDPRQLEIQYRLVEEYASSTPGSDSQIEAFNEIRNLVNYRKSRGLPIIQELMTIYFESRQDNAILSSPLVAKPSSLSSSPFSSRISSTSIRSYKDPTSSYLVDSTIDLNSPVLRASSLVDFASDEAVADDNLSLSLPSLRDTYTCDCGSVIQNRPSAITIHNRTQKHLKYVESLKQEGGYDPQTASPIPQSLEGEVEYIFPTNPRARFGYQPSQTDL